MLSSAITPTSRLGEETLVAGIRRWLLKPPSGRCTGGRSFHQRFIDHLRSRKQKTGHESSIVRSDCFLKLRTTSLHRYGRTREVRGG
jgi:hypothetical protein